MSSDTLRIKEKLNIVDIVRRYVDLKSVSGRWMCACPFHQETKPSMSINETEGFFYCFGCQASGDLIDFYMRINGLDFREALEELAKEAGIELSGRTAPDPQAEIRRQEKKIFLNMHTHAKKYFQKNLVHASCSFVKEYLQTRGLSPETIETFGLGASSEDWHGLDNYLQAQGFSSAQGVSAGLLSSNEKGDIYDRFRARLMFPIQNLSGQVIAFGGRIIHEDGPKYLNSSDSLIYKKGEHLYGLFQARKTISISRKVLLTEGYMDVLSLHQFGYKDACGVLGTALTPEQVKRLAGFCTCVNLLFDGDAPGRKAALRSAEMILLAGVKCTVILMPDGEDVDSILQTQGKKGLEQLLAQAEDGLSFATSMVRDEFAPKDAMAWATGFLKKLSEPALLAWYLPRLAGGLGLSEAELRSVSIQTPKTQQFQTPAQTGQTQAKRHIEPEDEHDRKLLGFPIQYPEYMEDLESRGFVSILVTSWGKALWEKMVKYHRQDIVSYLTDGEKKIWVQHRISKKTYFLTGEALKKEWEHHCHLIEKGKKRAILKQLKKQIRLAQEAGDIEALQKYSKEFNDALRRDDEQH